jgi:hypothetical protein
MILFSCYAAVILFLFVALLGWKLKNRPTQHPLGQDVKLRRQAGEHLRKESEERIGCFRLALIVL